ncbi:MAG TPA: YeeE/YedE family protein [Alphaproteobacteria bacterium]|nr:YeeE/YedE family protein [Alphaproteobacteria bacterium]
MVIGIAALVLLRFYKRIAGISGIFGGLFPFDTGETLWRLVFLAGLMTGGVVLSFLHSDAVDFQLTYSNPALILAGLLVGVGSRMGNGCTSGHGICGLGRLAPRSMAAVLTFMVTGILTAVVVQQLLGGAI